MLDSVFFLSVIVFSVAFLMSLSSTLLRRKFVDPEQSKDWQQTVKQWQADKERAKNSGDKKLAAKLRKQEKRINQMQSRMLKGQLITMAIQMAAFFIVWQVLIMYLGDKIVAFLPFQIPFIIDIYPYPMPFFYWYMICSFLSSIIIQKIFGMNTGMGMDMAPSA